MRRRDFLITSAIAAGTQARDWGQSSNRPEPDRTKLDRIAIMTLYFNAVLKIAAHPDDPKRTLDILDAPQMIADRYGVHHVEFQHAHFTSTQSSYLKEVHGRLRRA